MPLSTSYDSRRGIPTPSRQHFSEVLTQAAHFRPVVLGGIVVAHFPSQVWSEAGKPVKRLLTLVLMTFTCGLLGAALLSLALVLMTDQEPLDVVLVVLIITGGLVFLGQWLLGFAERLPEIHGKKR